MRLRSNPHLKLRGSQISERRAINRRSSASAFVVAGLNHVKSNHRIGPCNADLLRSAGDDVRTHRHFEDGGVATIDATTVPGHVLSNDSSEQRHLVAWRRKPGH